MDETTRFGLPLLMPSQAQKHVTVNESLARIDASLNLVLKSMSTAVPPSTVNDGESFSVPDDAVNDWAGQGGKVAIAMNGGWEFLTPQIGWRAFVVDRGLSAIFDGSSWVPGALSMSSHGAGLQVNVSEFDHMLSSGAVSTTEPAISASTMVIGVTARVIEPVTGTLTAWRLGTAGATDRFGSGLGLESDSWARGILGQPTTYWSPEPLLITAEGGEFEAGKIRIALHSLSLRLPSA